MSFNRKCKMVFGERLDPCIDMHEVLKHERKFDQPYCSDYNGTISRLTCPTRKTLLGMPMTYCPFCGGRIYDGPPPWSPTDTYHRGDKVLYGGSLHELKDVVDPKNGRIVGMFVEVKK